MKLFVYAEHTASAGHIRHVDPHTEDEADIEDCDDYSLWGEGDDEALIAEARQQLSVSYDTRPGGAGDAFRHKCARSVLNFFGEAGEQAQFAHDMSRIGSAEFLEDMNSPF